jgi:hypothetical protein
MERFRKISRQLRALEVSLPAYKSALDGTRTLKSMDALKVNV